MSITVEAWFRVTNAADRSQDRHYRKSLQLAAAPRSGDTILLGKYRREVVGVTWKPGEPDWPDTHVYVELKPDHETFKGADMMKRCAIWEALGFREFDGKF